LSSGNTSASSYWTINSSFFFARLLRPACVHSPAASLLPNRITPSQSCSHDPGPQTCVRSYPPWHPMLVAMPRPWHHARLRKGGAARGDGCGTITIPREPAHLTCSSPPAPIFWCTVTTLEIRRARRRRRDGWRAVLVAAARDSRCRAAISPLGPIVASTGKICGQDRWSTNKFHQERTC
jgi:hypothetical protein